MMMTDKHDENKHENKHVQDDGGDEDDEDEPTSW